MATTLKDLSEKLGVSTMTVSRAIRGRAGVSDEVRARILRTARKMDYQPERQHAARSLKSHAAGGPDGARQQVVCIVMGHDDSEDRLSFHGALLSGLREACAELRLDSVIADHCIGETPLLVQRGLVDGVVHLPAPHELRTGLSQLPVPCVSLLTEAPEMDSVMVDNFQGGRDLGRHLCELGHRRIAYIGPDQALAHQRLAGLRAAASEAGATVPDDLVHLSPDAGSEDSVPGLLGRLLAGRTGPKRVRQAFTALAVYNDYMAVHAIRCLQGQALRVPKHVSVTGFDGALPADTRGLRLTTAHIPLAEMGREALNLLSLRLQSPSAPPRKLVLSAVVRDGETTASPGR